MRLRWTTPAADDLYRIVRRIRQDNPAAVAEVARVLHSGCGSLRDREFSRAKAHGGVEGAWIPRWRTNIPTLSLQNQKRQGQATPSEMVRCEGLGQPPGARQEGTLSAID